MSQAAPAVRTRPRPSRVEAEASTSIATGRLADFGLILLFLALTFLLGAFPLKDTDFWWHLKTGDMIRRTGIIPRFDSFTYGAEGRPWIDLHWLFQVALSWGYAHGGVLTLNLAKCGITTLAVFLLISSRRRDWPVWVMLLAWIPALLVLSGRMYIRPETISLLYLSMVLAILFRWDRKPWLAFGLPLVQVCWVNTQGLFLLEPILILFALVDAGLRKNAFAREHRGWWRLVGTSTVLTGIACLFNPYGLRGTFYPIELAGTMSNPIFKNTIGELKPLSVLFEEVGFDNLTLRLHLVTFVLGGLSFLAPLVWSFWVRLVDRRGNDQLQLPAEISKGRKKRETARARRRTEAEGLLTVDSWRPSIFRGLAFSFFSALSVVATRNSHQFAAVVGCVTAWNFGEWVAAIRARNLRLEPGIRRDQLWPRVAVFVALGLTFSSVASGKYYVWAGEGRTVGLGEEPLWFPHAALKFAGGPGMPDRMVGFHNGHPALYEYYWSPEKKAYTDARLELMGADLYTAYTELGRKIRKNSGNWAEELDRMGRPIVLVDNVDQGNAELSATLFNSRHWRCVWFDPIVSLFVHDSLTKIIEADGVDFAARHFQREAESSRLDPPALAAMAKALRFVGTQCRFRASGEAQGQSMLLLGLDYARKLKAVDPGGLDGWKQAGLIEYIRELLPSDETIPRFRLTFDPVFDISPARATYDLSQANQRAPDDGYVQYFLAKMFQRRGMNESALPLLEKFVEQPNKNLSQQNEKTNAAGQILLLKSKIGTEPKTKWSNLGELERIVTDLLMRGRASTAADVMEAAYRPEGRPWEWADRLAVLRLHLGQPARARAIWVEAVKEAPTATRLSRIAATYLVEGDFVTARKFYREAISAAPASFEAHYGLAVLEQDSGHALEALAEARLAEKAATNDHSRAAARLVAVTVGPYAKANSASR